MTVPNETPQTPTAPEAVSAESPAVPQEEQDATMASHVVVAKVLDDHANEMEQQAADLTQQDPTGHQHKASVLETIASEFRKLATKIREHL